MPSNRLRSLRNVGTRLNSDIRNLGGLSRRGYPVKLAQNLINTGYMRRYSVTEPIVAPDAITTPAIDEGAVDTDEIADDAVTEPIVDENAATGKNIASCTITDSDVNNCRFNSFEGSGLTADNFDFTSGVIKQVQITGPATFNGSNIELSGVDLKSVKANTISSTGSLALGGGSVSVNAGAGFILTGGSGAVAMNGSFLSNTGGVPFNIQSGSATFGTNAYNFFANGVFFIPYNLAVSELNDIKQDAIAAKADADAYGDCICPEV